ncbi:AsmA-like C-terminal region-containing protein [Thiotrichales bacterium 19X7-9]|nr:AsmA-like C-terminal region-containing protein [Thiotrichales bacterium 19X7-9]
MKKVAKRILLIIISIIVAIILLACISFGVLNYYRFSPLAGFISNQASEALGQNVSLNGIYVGYSFDDGLSVSIQGLSITEKNNADKVDQEKAYLFAGVELAKVSFNLAPILSGNFKLNSLTVNHAIINYDVTKPFIIEKDQQTHAQEIEEQKTKTEKVEKPSKEEKTDFLWLNLLPKVIITDSTINYKDQNQAYHLQIKKQTLINTSKDRNQYDGLIKGNWIFNNISIDINGNIKSKNLKQKVALSLAIRDISNNHLSASGDISYNQKNELVYRLKTQGALTNLKQWQAALGTEYQQINELDQLNWQGNFSYDKLNSLQSNLTLSSQYNNLDYKILLNAHSMGDNPSIFPLSFVLKANDNQDNLNVAAKGYIDDKTNTQWLKAELTGQLKSPKKLFIKDQLPFDHLSLNATVIGNGNKVNVNDARFKATYQKKPFIVSFNYQLIKANDHFPMKFNFISSYNNHQIFELAGGAQWPIDVKNWLKAKLNVNADHIAQLLKDLNISTGNYQIQSIDTLINLSGEKPYQLIADIQPTKIKVNHVGFLVNGQLKSFLDKSMPSLDYDLKVHLNQTNTESTDQDTKNYFNLKGMFAHYQQANPWFNLSINGNIDSLKSIQPLIAYQLPDLTDLNIKMVINSSNDQLKFNIDTVSAKYLEKLLSLKGHGVYGIFQTNKPINGGLFLTYDSDSIQLNLNGFWEENQGINVNLLANIADLSLYSQLTGVKLPDILNINLRSQLSLFPHQLILNNLNFQSGANQTLTSLQLQGNYNFNNQLFKVLITQLDLNGLKVTGHASGQLSKANRHYQGTISVNAQSLSGLNQLLYQWFDFYLPELTNVKLSSDFKESNQILHMKLNTQSDSGDLTGNIQWMHQDSKHQLLAKLNSQYLNIYSIQQAMHNAQSTLKITSDALSLTAKKPPQSNEEKEKKAEAIKAKKAEIPNWMKQPLSSLLNQYQSDISYQIKTLILAKNEQSNNVLLKAQSSSKGALFSLTADTFFQGKVDFVGKLIPDIKLKNNYLLDLNGYIGTLKITPDNLLLDDTIPLDEGSLMMQVKAQSNGLSTLDLMKQLTGKMKIAGDSLKIKLFNSESVLGKFLLLLSGDKFSKVITVPCAYTLFDIEKGVLTIKDLLINSKGAIVTGEGTVDLVNQKIDITLTPKAKFINLSSIALPITISGTFSKLYIYPNTTGSIIKTGAAAALLATGIGAVGLVATEATTGTYRAYKDYCEGVLDKFE